MAAGPNDDKVQCYGTKIDCPNRAECELGAACLSRSRESSEDLHYQYQHVSVPEMMYDPNEDNSSRSYDDPDDDAEAAKAYFEAMPDDPSASVLKLQGITLNDETLPVVMQVVEKIAEWYFYTPHTFDALMNKIIRGKSQSDIAREKHITRQCENKRLLRELGIAQKRNDIQERRDRELEEAKRELSDYLESLRRRDEFLSRLSDRNWKIYLYRFFERRTARETAILVKCNIRTVFRVSYKLRKNLGKYVIPEELMKQKNAKKRKKYPVPDCR